ncbi:FAD binding domain family protein [Ceratocystis lukuohia]|uniref:Uncharacterized protein n=2 Tax=Ceratocystis TaxID=5157 RepID=A0A0F8BUK2_CERFI|nr:hypothetical protein CFO_g1415 [Ceratocystis platani]
MSPSPSPSSPEPAFNFDPQTLYLLVSTTSHKPSCPHHWSLLISRSTSEGDLLEPTEADNKRWAFSSTQKSAAQMQTMATDGTLLLATKLADVEEMLHPSLCSRVGRVPITKTNSHGDSFSSRLWCKQVLGELENEGYIDLKLKPSEIDFEVVQQVNGNQRLPMQQRVLVQTSKAFIRYNETGLSN